MGDEILDVCNFENYLTGELKLKSRVHKDGDWHRVAHVWAYKSNGELLMQLRSKDKDTYPNVWDIAAAGHVSHGEIPSVSASRETKEETGITIDPRDLNFYRIRKCKMVIDDMLNNEFQYIYTLKLKGNEELVFQKEEVDDLGYHSIPKIRNDLRTIVSEYPEHKNYWEEILQLIQRKTMYS